VHGNDAKVKKTIRTLGGILASHQMIFSTATANYLADHGTGAM
jgi:hypothetical protein